MTTLNRLTSLERVRDWVGVTSNNDDLILTRLIDGASRGILSYLGRPTMFQYIFSDIYDGADNKAIMLRNYPVQSVALVMVDGLVISPSVNNSVGYVLEAWDGMPPARPQTIWLKGYKFNKGYSNVNIVYNAGFVVNNELQIVPASGNYSVAVNAPYGSFAVDQGVVYAGGNSLNYVVSAPSVGQYTINNGVYVFAASDAGASVQISYSYTPSDIEQACMEMVAERYRYRSHIGEFSKNINGHEKIIFSQQDMSDYVKGLLQPYRRVV